jgi:hypothetical protein
MFAARCKWPGSAAGVVEVAVAVAAAGFGVAAGVAVAAGGAAAAARAGDGAAGARFHGLTKPAVGVAQEREDAQRPGWATEEICFAPVKASEHEGGGSASRLLQFDP